MDWILTTERKPKVGQAIEVSENGVDVEDTQVYLKERTCMMAGVAGGHGYFDEGFATDGEGCDYGLICEDPKYWRLVSEA